MPQGQGQQAARARERGGEGERERERQWKREKGRRGRQGKVVGGSGSADYSSIFLIWNYTSIDWGVNGLRDYGNYCIWYC